MKPLLIITFLMILLTSINALSAAELGFSGMEKYGDNSFLLVTDKKGHKKGTRIAVLTIKPDGKLHTTGVDITDWKHPDGQSSDLESLCRIPNKSNEFLLAESGSWEGKYGRIFHIELSEDAAFIKHIYPLPIKVGSKKGIQGDNYEGMVCLEKDGVLYVILGERGGSRLYQNGFLRIGVFDYPKAEISWDLYANQAVEITPPKPDNVSGSQRSISDLFLDEQGIIWAVATEDAGDNGPFRSVIYPAAKVSAQPDAFPLQKITSTKATWVIDGFKVESLAGPASHVPGSYMSIGTEDESYGGTWRPLYAPYNLKNHPLRTAN